MVSVITQPYTSAGFSYSSSMGQNNNKQLRQFTRDDLRRCMKEGLVYEEIKEQYPKLPITRYRKMLKTSGYEPDHVRITRRVDADIAQLFNAGMSAEQIAEKYNWTLATCKNRLRNLGISTMVFIKEEIPDNVVAKVRKMAEVEGQTQLTISKKLKIGIKKLKLLMEDNGIMTPAMKRAERVGDLKRSTIAEALKQFGNINDASKHLGVSKSTLQKYIKQLNVIV